RRPRCFCRLHCRC
nr:corticostatic peptide GP-CS3 - guinea pig [Cavia porcellus]AAB20160.1 GP-CS3=corticostatic peptide [guinea pigs, bone marrow, Peptide Partial, 13 aa] [Cavia]